MKNEEVASLLREIADFLEMEEVEYKPRAYRKAARNVESLSEPIEDVHERGDLEEIDGVGESIAEKIAEYLETGELDYYRKLKADLDLDVEAITSVQGIGPKTAKKLYRELGVEDLQDLERAAESGRIAEVEGFGEKTQENVLEHVELAKRGQERTLLGRAFSRAEEIEGRLEDAEEFDRVEIVGSFRRRRPTVGDIDVLATAPDREAAMDRFVGFEDVQEVIARGETKSSITVPEDLRVDLRIVDPECWGSALMYFTGSKDHNITVRDRALDRGWKLNEYGLFDVRNSDAPASQSGASDDVSDVEADEEGQRAGERIAGESEEEVFEALDLEWIPPELREDTGEVEAAAEGALPDLVGYDDLRGDLQVHTEYSDGSNTVREMAAAAEERGYDYLAITDHGPSLRIAGGVSTEDLRDQREEIEEANADDDLDVEVLQGVEANVTEDGLDVSAEWCERLDVVLAAMHEPPEEPTGALVDALSSYPVDVIAHPTNRRINEREPIDLDLEEVIETATAEGVALEIDAQPERLDLDWTLVKEYREDVDFTVSTDAHDVGELDFAHLGVAQARRGWLEASDVLNTKPLADLPFTE